MSVVCLNCGQETPEGFPRCANCGAELAAEPAAAREERKVVTVLFCDLVGFTGRAESMDPEDVRALLSGFHEHVRRELERYGGTVEKFVGDAVMALFGAPIAHEDDPERAVRAALAIRDDTVRIGITTGEALVSLDASPESGEGMASGDVVNTASRLQTSASPGAILVDEATYRATEQAIDYRRHDPAEAKGKAEPIVVWEAIEARSHLGVDVAHETHAPLVGRDRELDLLLHALRRAESEEDPQLVTLVGVPGIGKSRLVWELLQAVERKPELVTWRQGRSLPYGEGVSYWALGEMVKAQAGILESDGADAAADKLRQATTELLTEAEASWVDRHLGPLVGLRGEGTAEDGREESFAAWRRFFEAVAERGPAVLVFEDLHWADDGLLDFIDHLVDWATAVPLLVVCTARPELLGRRPGWGGGKANVLMLSLAPLSTDETTALLHSLLERSVLPADVQHALVERAGGNPLYAEEFARMLAERGGGAVSVPETVQGIIAARLDGLAPDDKQLAQDAAVVGKVFWLGAVAAVAGVAPAAAEHSLHELERRDFVRRTRRSSVETETEYAFRHVLVRDVAYAQIPRGARVVKHRRAAGWIESLGRAADHADQLAHHYLAALEFARAAGMAPDGLDEQARRALGEAGDRALALSALPAAAAYYEAALDLSTNDHPDRPHLLLRYARSRAEDVALDERLLEEGIEGLLRSGDRSAAGEAETLLGWVWWQRGENNRALGHLERAVELVRGEPASPAKAYVLTHFARFLMLADDERGLASALEALAMAEELGLEGLRARNLNSVGLIRVTAGEIDAGLEDLRRAVEIAAAANSPEHAGAAQNRAWVTGMTGDIRRAWELHLESTAIAERFGMQAQMRWERGERIFYLYWRGEWSELERQIEEFLAEVEGGTHYLECVCHEFLGRLRFARGDVTAALSETERAVELARRVKDRQTVEPALVARTEVLIGAGRQEEAERVAAELVGASESGLLVPYASAAFAWVARELGDVRALKGKLDADTSGNRWYKAAKLVLDGVLVAAADEFAAIGSVPDEAYARLQAAKQLVEAGRRTEADGQLDSALAFYRRVGASQYVRQGEALLKRSA